MIGSNALLIPPKDANVDFKYLSAFSWSTSITLANIAEFLAYSTALLTLWKPDCNAFAVELIMSILLLATSWPASEAFFVNQSNCSSVPVNDFGATFNTFLIAVSVSTIILPILCIDLVICIPNILPRLYIDNVDNKLFAKLLVLLIAVLNPLTLPVAVGNVLLNVDISFLSTSNSLALSSKLDICPILCNSLLNTSICSVDIPNLWHFWAKFSISCAVLLKSAWNLKLVLADFNAVSNCLNSISHWLILFFKSSNSALALSVLGSILRNSDLYFSIWVIKL